MANLMRAACAAAIGAATLGLCAPAEAQTTVTTAQTLLDRIQIEDLITSYYGNLGGGGKGFGAYYVPDATFDVNGKVYKGQADIERAYRELGAASPAMKGTFHMVLSNPMIEVKGDTAVARFLWTGILNESIKAPPRFVEQGREYDVLVRRNGEWRIRQRTVIADSGMPDFFDQTYSPRKDYDPLKP